MSEAKTSDKKRKISQLTSQNMQASRCLGKLRQVFKRASDPANNKGKVGARVQEQEGMMC